MYNKSMELDKIKPQIAVLGGYPGSGKSTIARTLRDHFGFPADQIVSYDKVAKEQYLKIDPNFDITQDVPKDFYMDRMVKLDRLRIVYGQARAIVNDGKPALVHLGCIGRMSRAALAVGTLGKKVSGFWLEADHQELLMRLAQRRFENLSHGSADPERLAAVFHSAVASAPKNWRTIKTHGITPVEAAAQILEHLEA